MTVFNESQCHKTRHFIIKCIQILCCANRQYFRGILFDLIFLNEAFKNLSILIIHATAPIECASGSFVRHYLSRRTFVFIILPDGVYLEWPAECWIRRSVRNLRLDAQLVSFLPTCCLYFQRHCVFHFFGSLSVLAAMSAAIRASVAWAAHCAWRHATSHRAVDGHHCRRSVRCSIASLSPYLSLAIVIISIIRISKVDARVDGESCRLIERVLQPRPRALETPIALPHLLAPLSVWRPFVVPILFIDSFGFPFFASVRPTTVKVLLSLERASHLVSTPLPF